MNKRTTSIGFAHIHAILYGAQIMFTSAGNSWLVFFSEIPSLESVAFFRRKKKTSVAIWCQAHLDDYISCNSIFIMSYFLSNNDEIRRDKLNNSIENHFQIHFQIQRFLGIKKCFPIQIICFLHLLQWLLFDSFFRKIKKKIFWRN